LIAFYGIQPSELAALSEEEIQGLVDNMPRISARRRLEFVCDVMAAMPSDGKGVSHYLTALIKMAFDGDETAKAIAIEAITRH